MNAKVIVSMTTINKRVPNVHRVIESICLQTRIADEVHLYLSSEGYLLDSGISCIPPALEACIKMFRVIVHYVPNTGPYRKLLPILKEAWQQNVCIVTIDDDTIYPPFFLEMLLSAFERHHCIIAFSGRRITFDRNGAIRPYLMWPNMVERENKHMMNLPLGKDGVLYRPEFFTEKVFDAAAHSLCPSADDIWFRCNTWIRRIPACILKTPNGIHFSEVNSGPGKLWRLNKGKNTNYLKTVTRHLGLSIPSCN